MRLELGVCLLYVSFDSVPLSLTLLMHFTLFFCLLSEILLTTPPFASYRYRVYLEDRRQELASWRYRGYA